MKKTASNVILAAARIQRHLKTIIIIFSVLFVTYAWAGPKTLMMATTTSTDNTGLLNYLAPRFKQDTGITLKWVAVGTGKALAIGQRCDADVLLVHAPKAEEKFVAKGYGVGRAQVMYNDFVLIGPKKDPALVEYSDIIPALQTIDHRQATFISRGDDSGTNKKELQLWKLAKIKLPKKSAWYLQSGQGMMQTIYMAEEKDAYTLTDRGTYIKYLANNRGYPLLKIMSQGDKLLRNQYSVILVNHQRCPNTNLKAAKIFKKWLLSPKIQRFIGKYRLRQQKLFIPNAK